MNPLISKEVIVLTLLVLSQLVINAKAIEPLSDNDLDRLTAGAATLPTYGQVLPQTMTGNFDIVDGTTLGAQSVNSVGDGDEVIITANSQAVQTINNNIQLTDSIQQHINLANIVNSVGSDSINTINIATAGVQASLLIQNNNTHQAQLNSTSLGLSDWTSGYRYDKSVQTYTRSINSNSISEQIQRDYSQNQTRHHILYDVAIEKYDPRLLLAEIKVSTPVLGPLTLIPSHHESGNIAAGSIVDAVDIFDIIPNSVDYELGWGATTLELPVFSAGIDATSVTHENLTINLTAEPPKLEIGNVYFNTQAHYDDRSDNVIHWIDTQPISFAPPDINIDLDVPNPLYGLDLSINHGFALAGNGEIKGDFGGFNSMATVNFTNILSHVFPIDEFIAALDIGVDVINTLDFLDIFPDIPKPGEQNLDLVISIPLEINLNDFAPDSSGLGNSVVVSDPNRDYAFNLKYNGVFCFELFGDGNCGSMTDKITTLSWLDHSYTGTFMESHDASDSYSDSIQSVIRTGGQISGVEAEKIILSGSDLVSTENSLIQIDAQAQQNAKVLNLSNVSNTIAANSLNMQNFKSIQFNSTIMNGYQVQQSNRFVQMK